LCRECEAESEGTIALPEQDLQLPVSPTPLSTRGFSLPIAQPQVASIGDYEIIDKLGQGGMGAVYRARQISLDRVVALKVLPQQFEEDDDFVARFQREATVAARLNHPNLVRVYSSGVADGSHFIAMELIEGENLRQRMKREPVPMSEALRICADVARALQCGWDSARLIHRDIKPANIYLSHAGEVKLGDLGLAKSTLANTTGITQTGTSLGTPLYMSPEQGKGEKNIDFRSDIYSLGCTLYELLTGKPPYEGRDGHTLIHQHIHAPLPAILKVLPGCPMPLVRLVGKMLRKQPRERHAGYEDLIAEMEHIREQLESGVTTTGPSKVVEVWKQVGDLEAKPAASFGLLWAGLAILLVAGAGVTVFVLNKKDEPVSAKSSTAKSQPATPTEALKLAGASAPSPSIASAPTWQRLYPDLSKLPALASFQDGWARRSEKAADIQLQNPPATTIKLTNAGVRARFRVDSDSSNQMPYLKLRRGSDSARGDGIEMYYWPGQDARMSLHWRRANVSFTDARLANLSLKESLPPGTEYTLELYTIGRSVIGRFQDQTLRAELPVEAVQGGEVAILAAHTTSFRDVEYLNLDGLPEAEALKLAGVSSGAASPAGSAAAERWENLLIDPARLKWYGESRRTTDGVFLDKSGVRLDEKSSPDGAIRLRAIYQERQRPQLRARRNPATGNSCYMLHTAADRGSLGRWDNDQTGWTKIVDFPLKTPLVVGQPFELELRAVGETLTALVNGEVVATATDRTIPSGSFGAASAGAEPAPITALEYRDLSPAAASATERWENLLLDPEMLGKLRKTADGYIVSTAATLARGSSRDGAVRCRVRFDPADAWFRILAGKEETRWYQAAFSSDERGVRGGYIQYVDIALATGKYADANNQTKTSLRMPIPPGQFVDVELRVAGDTLRLSLNGEVVATARDTQLGLGRWGISGNGTHNNTLIQSLEYLDLSANSSSSTTPATATKDAPFVNSLGMKFVPVPIAGGPTAGQRVLFSVWETRVQDYETFASETKRGWGKPKFEQGPTHPAANVSPVDARAFCAWLTERERKAGQIAPSEAYRLPSGHEWSCALGRDNAPSDATARPSYLNNRGLPPSRKFLWGADPVPPAGFANYAGEERGLPPGGEFIAGWRDDHANTAPVGSYPPSASGLFDLAGNVWEMNDEPYNPGEANVVTRGSSFEAGAPERLRASVRSQFSETARYDDTGFRVVLAPAP